jgi:hypothetical protein
MSLFRFGKEVGEEAAEQAAKKGRGFRKKGRPKEARASSSTEGSPAKEAINREKEYREAAEQAKQFEYGGSVYMVDDNGSYYSGKKKGKNIVFNAIEQDDYNKARGEFITSETSRGKQEDLNSLYNARVGNGSDDLSGIAAWIDSNKSVAGVIALGGGGLIGGALIGSDDDEDE